jgi:hypothetical protein
LKTIYGSQDQYHKETRSQGNRKRHTEAELSHLPRVKTKLNLSLTTPRRREYSTTVTRSRRLVEGSVQRHAPAALPRERKGGSHFRRGWVGPKAGIDVLEITKFTARTGTRNSVRPAPSLVARPTELPRLPYVIALLRIN